MSNNEIPQQLLDKWQKETEQLYPYIEDGYTNDALRVLNKSQDVCRHAYIEGCKSTYLSMQAEIERRDNIIKELWYDTCLDRYKQGTDLDKMFLSFKTEHNL